MEGACRLLSKFNSIKTIALRVWSCYCFVVQQRSSISFARLLLLELVIYYNLFWETNWETDLGNRRGQMNDSGQVLRIDFDDFKYNEQNCFN